MYGDSTTIRALAGRLRERADEIRDLAATLTTRTASVPWTGLAADALRTHVAVRVAALRGTATLHDDAAEALDRHAAEVDRRADLLAAAVDGVVDGATDLIDELKELLT